MSVTHDHRARRGAARAIALAMLLVFTPLAAGPGHAGDEYDEKDTNPLRVVYYVVYPVGKLLEWTVFRPLHFIGSRIAPDERREPSDRVPCRGERPGRHCTEALAK